MGTVCTLFSPTFSLMDHKTMGASCSSFLASGVYDVLVGTRSRFVVMIFSRLCSIRYPMVGSERRSMTCLIKGFGPSEMNQGGELVP